MNSFDVNLVINLNFTLFGCFEGLWSFVFPEQITVSVAVDCNNHMVYILCHILPCAPNES